MDLAAIIAIVLPLFSMAAYATFGYLSNLSGDEAKARFNPQKIVGVFLISVLFAGYNYFNGIEVSVDMIIQMLATNAGWLYFADKGYKTLLRSTVAVGTVTSIPATNTTGGWDGTLGLTIVPTEQEGTSPFTAQIKIRSAPTEGDYMANEATIDWGDSSLTTSIPLEFGEGYASHVYTFKRLPDGKSWSKMFRPTVTVRNNQGNTKEAYVVVYAYDPDYISMR